MSNPDILKEIILDNSNILLISKEIESITNISIDINMIYKVVTFIKDLNFKIIFNSFNNVESINHHLSKVFIRDYINPKKFDFDDDIKKNYHEYAYKQIQKDTKKMLNQDTNNFQQYIKGYDNEIHENFSDNYQSSINKYTLNHIENNTITFSIDTKMQNRANRDLTKFNFVVTNNTKVRQRGSGNITAVGNITNIVKFIIHPFSIPYIESANNIFNQIRMRINDFHPDRIEDYDFWSHWTFDSKINEKNNRIDLIPINNTYEFRKPITEMNKLSISFGNPTKLIKFNKDQLLSLPINYTNNEIQFEENHNLKSGDQISIDNFETNNLANDYNIIENIKNNFHKVDVTDCKTICVPTLQLPNIKNPKLNYRIFVYFESKRIMFNLTCIYQINDNT